MTTQQFLIPIPEKFLEDDATTQWATYIHNFLDDLARIGGDLETIRTTETTVDALLDSLPAYTITNDSTDRAFDANAAAGAITNPPTQAEVENIRDAVLELADVMATIIKDLATKNILG